MSLPRIERIGDAIRVHFDCPDCRTAVMWKHIEIADDGRYLAGHCHCASRRHRYILRPDDKVIGADGKRM